MRKADEALLRLLRGEGLMVSVSADEVMQAAVRQTVVGVAADVLPRPVGMRWVAMSAGIVRQNVKVSHAVSELAKLLDDHKIRYVVFKGQVVATCYRNPSLRQSGDVDFYVAKADFLNAAMIIEREWNVAIDRKEEDLHWAFGHDGVAYEMHYKCATFGRNKHQRYFDNLVEEETLSGNCTVQIDGYPVRKLSPELEIAHIFKHMFYHLLVEGVGLRQAYDMAVLLSHEDAYDAEKLKAILANVGYLKAFNTAITMTVDYMGVKPIAAFDCTRHKDARQMMEDILAGGNFGRSSYKNHSPGLKKSIETAMLTAKHMSHYISIATGEILGLIPQRIRIFISKYI